MSAAAVPGKVVAGFCRVCQAYCPILVTVRDGKAVKVAGDPQTPYDGYTCPKGRDLPAQHNDPDRLLRCKSRGDDGLLHDMPSSQVVSEVAGKLAALVEKFGPRCVAVYSGTGTVGNPAGTAMGRAFASAIGTDLVFSANAIDKPAANISTALHGSWHAGAHAFEASDTWMVIGANPVIAKTNGAPPHNPGQRLKEALARGMQLIVVDPRRTETARRARIHLQLRPGTDAVLLAGLVHVILREDLVDHTFVQENAEGLEALRSAVAPYTPAMVSARAGVPADQVVEAARLFAAGRRGGTVCSTGASFGPHANLTWYLALCLNTLCGRWVRAGEDAPLPNVLLPAYQPRAQPYAPYPVFGKSKLRVHGLRENASGMPTAGLADDILLGGDDGIKALLVVGGNPAMAWPDQRKAEAALRSLELLVVIDVAMTATAQLADYVVAAPMTLELPCSTSRVEALKYLGVTRGFTIPWAQYAPRIVEPPAGADLVHDAAFFFRLAQRMGLQLTWTNVAGYRAHVESPPVSVKLDMAREPSDEDWVALTCEGSRVPLEEVKRYPHGKVFTEVATKVAPRDAACETRLQLADATMVAELASMLTEAGRTDDEFPLLQIGRAHV